MRGLTTLHVQWTEHCTDISRYFVTLSCLVTMLDDVTLSQNYVTDRETNTETR